MKVEVFVNSEKVPIVADHSSFASDHAACRGTIYKEESYAKYKTKKAFTESSRRIIEEATKKAKELNAKVRVYDLSTLRGKIIAKLKGVDYPTWRVVE
ncbi:MAG: hypothetical protein ACE5L6_02905 [Candidatus Bathyarchaeia archaeon]